jgi:DNA polymerase-1
MKTLLLIDGSSYLYRSYHALPDMRNSQGFPTSVLYGVINMLRRLLKETPADYIACVFDAKGKTFRDAWYAEYKANRPNMPDDMRVQIAPLHAIIRAMGLPILCVEGVEADDVIGTLAMWAESHQLQVIISTGDKDMTQLVTPRVRLENSMSKEVLDEKAVFAKFGVHPGQMIDYLSLVGDSIDNVPGVDKVGPKTAVKWLQEYGSLEQILAHANEIKGVVGENLRKAADWLPIGKKLVTIRCDIDLQHALPQGVESLVRQTEDTTFLLNQFREFDFRTWTAQMEAKVPTLVVANTMPIALSDVTPVKVHYETITTQAQLNRWLEKLHQAILVSFDTETTSLDPLQAQIVGLSFSCTPQEAAYIPLAHRYAEVQLDRADVLAQLTPWLESAQHGKLGQSSKYDQHVLANYGISLRGIVHDTLLQSYVLASHERHNMDALAARLLNVKTTTYEEIAGKGAKQISFDEVDVKSASDYAAEDADITLRLHQCMFPQIQQNAELRYIYEEIEMPTREVLFKMERNGVLIDAMVLQKQSHELGCRLIELEKEAFALAGQPFNLGSPKQVGEILFQLLKLPVIKKTPKGVPSTDEDVLQQLALDYPLPKKLLEHRSLSKLKSTYTDKLPQMINPKTGRVHTNYSQTVAVTGRLASSEPNLQNIPVRTLEGRRVREAFIAPPGNKIISADYSQIELRIMAHLSQDPGLLKAFAHGDDIHRATAAEIFGISQPEVTNEQRRHAKTINFGLIYGMSVFGLAAQLEIERSAAKVYIDRYFARYPGVAAYMENTRQLAREQGFVATVFGRRLWLPEINSHNPMRRQAAERAAINAPMQGTAADLIKLAMIAVHNWLEEKALQSRLIMQVHDELVLEVPEQECQLVQENLPLLMQHVASLSVPLLVEVGIGNNWEEAH